MPAEAAGKKLVTFLADQFARQYPARQLKQAIEQNRCRVNGRVERFASFVLGAGDRISLDLSGFGGKEALSWVMEKERILFEDHAILAYNKPSGISCDAEEVKKVSGLTLLHRLDRETTGVLLFAKDLLAAEALLLQFKKHEVEKTYFAIVDGVLPAGKGGIIDNALEKKKAYQGQALWGEVEKGQGKGLYAYTEWRCVKAGKEASLVECFPKTGRTHQLRVHLAGMGHPILGDFQYGKRFRCAYRPGRHLLHAWEVRFNHPATGKLLRIQAPLPDDFVSAQKSLAL